MSLANITAGEKPNNIPSNVYNFIIKAIEVKSTRKDPNVHMLACDVEISGNGEVPSGQDEAGNVLMVDPNGRKCKNWFVIKATAPGLQQVAAVVEKAGLSLFEECDNLEQVAAVMDNNLDDIAEILKGESMSGRFRTETVAQVDEETGEAITNPDTGEQLVSTRLNIGEVFVKLRVFE